MPEPSVPIGPRFWLPQLPQLLPVVCCVPAVPIVPGCVGAAFGFSHGLPEVNGLPCTG